MKIKTEVKDFDKNDLACQCEVYLRGCKEYARECLEKRKEKKRNYAREYRNKYRQKNLEYTKKYQKEHYEDNATTKQWLNRIPSTDKPLFKNGQVTVGCKMCHKKFAPTKQQIQSRWASWNGKKAGESNFYCSKECKSACPLFNFKTNQTDPESKLYIPKTEQQEVRACQTRTLKQMQCDEVGYNYCERCGDIIDVELHHTLPVAKFGKEAINPAGHMLLCAGCHVELHKECRWKTKLRKTTK